MARLHSRTGRARRIGLTGPPGAGKSTITALMVKSFRDAGLTVGVIAVDPTSPFTGGALLGDRVRMENVALDPGVFIRSMATRGSLGGLAAATREVADVLDAFGFDRLLIETVGVGQSELDVARTAELSRELAVFAGVEFEDLQPFGTLGSDLAQDRKHFFARVAVLGEEIDEHKNEFYDNGALSLLLTLANIFLIWLSGMLMFRIKEILPVKKTVFWEDLGIARKVYTHRAVLSSDHYTVPAKKKSNDEASPFAE